MESSIYYVTLEGLKQINSLFPPEENSSALQNLRKTIEDLNNKLQNKDLGNFKTVLKPFSELIILIIKSLQSVPPQTPLNPDQLILYDKIERLILKTFHLIFLQSSPGNYPDKKSTSTIILNLSNLFYAIAFRTERPPKVKVSNNPKDSNQKRPTIYESESLKFLFAQVCHACLSSIPGSLYVHGKMFKRLFELLYRSFSMTRDIETHDKIRAIIEDIILLLFNRYNEPDSLPEFADNIENSALLLAEQVTTNIMRNTAIIRTFFEPLLMKGYYKIRIIDVDICILISNLCQLMQSIEVGIYSMAYAAHFLVFVLNTKSDFYQSEVFTYTLNRYMPSALTFALFSRHDYFTDPAVQLILTIYRKYSTHFTGNFEVVLADGLLTSLRSPNKYVLLKGITTFSQLITSELNFMPDIFANLDCNKWYTNIFQRLTEIIADNTYPTKSYQKECLDIVHSILEMMKEFVTQMPKLKLRNKDKLKIKSTENIDRNDNLYELALFNRYSLEMTGIKIFNQTPARGVFYFIQNKIIKEDTASAVAEYLFNCEKLDKLQLALFLTEPANAEYLNHFMLNYSFLTAKNYDGALRIFIDHIGLPRNSERIQILTNEFGKLYQKSRTLSEFRSAKAVSAFTMKILAYQGYEQRYVLLQKSDLSEYANDVLNNEVTTVDPLPELSVPPLSNFIEMMKGINDGSDLPLDFLKLVHFNISTAPIILAPLDSPETPIKERSGSKSEHNSSQGHKTHKKAKSTPRTNEEPSTPVTPIREKKKHHTRAHLDHAMSNENENDKNENENEDSHIRTLVKLKKRRRKKKRKESTADFNDSIDLEDQNLDTNDNELQDQNLDPNDNESQDQNDQPRVSQSEFLSSFRVASSLSFPLNAQRDKTIEWYLCKCNQIALLLKNLPVHQEEFYNCKSAYVIKPMFESIWGSIHGPIIANIEAANEEDDINEHLDNLNLCISIAARNGSAEALTILMSSLVTFTGLQNPLFSSNESNQGNSMKMTQKNVISFKKLLHIAMTEADFLAPVWHIFIDQLSLVDLNKPKELLTEDNDVLDQIGGFFAQSSKFEFDSIVAFINAMIKTCDRELKQPNRRFYMLEKLILVAQYNMKRPTNEWYQIWDIIGNNYLSRLIQAGDNEHDFDLSKMIISHLRYLSSRYLLLDESPEEANQYNFLMTFLNVFQDQSNEKSKIYLLECLNSLIQETSPSIKSGWIMIFQILTIATAESFSQEIALKMLGQLVTNKIVLDNPRYLIHLIAFIATYSRNSNSTAAIQYFTKICECMPLYFDKCENPKSLRRTWIELFNSIGRSSQSPKIEVRRLVQEVYLKCLVLLAEKVKLSDQKESKRFKAIISDIWETAISSTFEMMWFCEFDKFLEKLDERFIQKYSTLLGTNIKHVIRILILSVFKGRNDEVTSSKKNKQKVDEVCLISIHILLNLVSSDIQQSIKEYVITLLSQTVSDIPNLSIDQGRSYVYLLNQFAKNFNESINDFIGIFTSLSDTMLKNSTADAVKRNIICALARESLLDVVMACNDSIMNNEAKAKVIDETLLIYLNSGYTKSPDSEAGKEWSRVICQTLHIVNSLDSDETFSIYFEIIAENLLKLIESSCKKIRTELGIAVERKLM